MRPKGSTAAWLVAAALLSSWAVSSASDEARQSRQSVPAPDRAMPAESREIAAETARLSARVRQAPRGVLSTGRNPFVLSAPPTAAPVARVTGSPRDDSPVIADAVEPAAIEILDAPVLAALVEMTAGATTAVISFGGELHYASRGAVIADRYRVDAISGDGVDIFDLSLGTHSRLTLRQAR